MQGRGMITVKARLQAAQNQPRILILPINK
jgi:hypothetical protein